MRPEPDVEMRGQRLVERLRVPRAQLFALVCVAVLLHPGAIEGATRVRSGRPTYRPPEKGLTRPARGTRDGSRRATRSKRTRHPTAARPRAVPERGSRGIVDEHVHVRRGDTLASVLAQRGVTSDELWPWLAAAADVYDLRRLRPGRGITLTFDRATRALEAVRCEVDERTMLVLESSTGGVAARREELPYFIEVKGVAGRIERGLREDAIDAGVPPRVVGDLADLLGWDVDVESGLEPGDEFRVLYENVWQTGLGRAEAGNVLAATVVSGGERLTAVYFEDADGNGAYYRPSGTAVTRTLLRYPVEFTDITSGFSLIRHHPILHVGRPHNGVDLAAPYGTPVRAAGDGHVSHAGWLRGLGLVVRIDHSNGRTSLYGHLSRILPIVDEGAAVSRGQVIGFVGATGLATGPHLHYELEQDGEHVDPLRISVEAEASIAPTERRAFERVTDEVTRQLARLPENNQLLTVSLSPPAYDED